MSEKRTSVEEGWALPLEYEKLPDAGYGGQGNRIVVADGQVFMTSEGRKRVTLILRPVGAIPAPCEWDYQ